MSTGHPEAPLGPAAREPASINRLPSELITLILNFVAQPAPTPSTSPAYDPAPTLAAAARVHSSWTERCRHLLWHRLAPRSDDQMVDIIEHEGFGKFVTQSLVVLHRGGIFLNGELVRILLKGLVGLEYLHLDRCPDMPFPLTLMSESLSGLKSLTLGLDNASIHKLFMRATEDRNDPATSYPFTLTELHILANLNQGWVGRVYNPRHTTGPVFHQSRPPRLDLPLIVNSLAPSISMTLKGVDETTMFAQPEGFLHYLPLLAPRITNLTLLDVYPPPRHRCIPTLLPLCSNLYKLTVISIKMLSYALAAAPPALKTIITPLTLDSYDCTRDVDVDDVVKSMVRAGGVVLRNAVTKDAIVAMEKDFRAYLDADKEWEDDFFPPTSRRVVGLLGKSDTFTNTVFNHPVYQSVCDKILTSSYRGWFGSERFESTSLPQLSSSIVFSIGPAGKEGKEGKDQVLHRDDSSHHVMNDEITEAEWTARRETAVGFFVAGGAHGTTKANGATRFIPGSHLYGIDHPPSEEDAVHVELAPTDGFLMLASCYHGGSANMTTHQERLVFSCFMTKGYLRQEENQYLAVPAEKVRKFPLEIQKKMGYELSEPFGGWVDLDSPLVWLNKNSKPKED
ncbi:Phytanoyl-CoA dioxygenase [Pseudohyphozyma bogoriensis]|nr:Phytanoyl-CoA dioxygenase [Pseudohyphozyma bogoriensis]